MKKIAVLSSSIDQEADEIARFFSFELAKNLAEKAEVTLIFYRNMEFSIVKNEASIVDSESGMDLKDFDLVYVKAWSRWNEAASAIGEYLNFHNVKFVPEEIGNYRIITKVTEYFKMWSLGYPVPDTYYTTGSFRSEQLFDKAKADGHDRVIVKDSGGWGGEFNYRIETKEELRKILDDNKGIEFIMQGFVPNKEDYRILIIGGKTQLIIKRSRADDTTHLNNTSQGAAADLVALSDFDPKIIADSENLAKAIGRDTAGVDLMYDLDGNHYFLEINKSPQLGSGAYIDEKSKAVAENLSNILDEL